MIKHNIYNDMYSLSSPSTKPFIYYNMSDHTKGCNSLCYTMLTTFPSFFIQFNTCTVPSSCTTQCQASPRFYRLGHNFMNQWCVNRLTSNTMKIVSSVSMTWYNWQTCWWHKSFMASISRCTLGRSAWSRKARLLEIQL